MFELTPDRAKGSGIGIESVSAKPARRHLMSMTQAMLQEFDNEAATTRRVLERVPNDKLAWKPHPKSMSLGVLALHVAGSPAAICGWAAEDETHFKGEPNPAPGSTDEILAAHDQSVTTSKETLGRLGDEGLQK